MKKNISAFLFLCLFVCLFSSCTYNEKNLYTLRSVTDREDSVFSFPDDLYARGRETVPATGTAETTIHMGKQTVTAKPLEILIINEKKINLYLNRDETMEYAVSEDTTYFSVARRNGSVLAPYMENELTEKKLLDHVKAYVYSYLDEGYLDSYQSGCYTFSVISKENAAWSETGEGFYTARTEEERITGYRIEFNKYAGDYPIADRVIVFCDEKGNVERVLWKKVPVDLTSVTVDSEKVRHTLDFLLEKYLNPDYGVEGYDIEDNRLCLTDEGVGLSVSLSVRCHRKGVDGGFVILLPLILDIAPAPAVEK